MAVIIPTTFLLLKQSKKQKVDLGQETGGFVTATPDQTKTFANTNTYVLVNVHASRTQLLPITPGTYARTQALGPTVEILNTLIDGRTYALS